MAQDGFTQLIDDSNAFFAQLKQNNTKDWFNPRKDHYNANIKKPAEFLADLLAEDFSRIAGTTFQPKLFRIYRDVRFSKDKTPLNAHLHMMWRQPGDNPFAPVFFFGSEPGIMTAGFGIMGLKGETLARFRAFIDRHGSDLEEAVRRTEMDWSDWGPPPLKRVPAPYDTAHPRAELLKKKGMTISTRMEDSWRDENGGWLRQSGISSRKLCRCSV
ncbi:DUF2461 domain-containing protein [Sulfitobacter aestuariivivens]|uniref:DUF2461 domain-containing protein n=1 Tax=Sulfitobacter aestuariivivens TaxID=2766981 RepID=UPI00360B00E0